MDAVRLVHTADLDAAELAEIRALLERVFPDDLEESDVEHALGGLHALVRRDGRLVAHGAVVMRRLLHEGRALRTGYVEAVAVDLAHRRRGLGSAVMAALEDVIARAYDIGALGASDEGAALYRRRGWRPWAGTTSVVAPDGLRRTPEEDGSVHVLDPRALLRPGGDLACDWREGAVW